MKKILLLLPAILLLSFTSDSGRSIYQVPLLVRSICSTDLDLDGNMDIITGHQVLWLEQNPSFTILHNFGSGQYQLIDSSKTFCGTQNNIFAILMDSDDYPDIVTSHADFSSGNADRFIRVFYSDQGNFSRFQDFTLNSSSNFDFINYGDFNGDGHYDIVLTSHHDQLFSILFNDGNGGLTFPLQYNTENPYSTKIACGDLDGNGLDDIHLAGINAEIYFSYPDYFERFELENGMGHTFPVIVDFDKDQDLDIVSFSSLLGHSWISIQENIDGHSFNLIDDFNHEGWSDAFSVADFNNDSLPDVVFHLSDNTGLMMYYNMGDLTLGNPLFVEVNGGTYSASKISCNDYDNNGYNDVAFTVNTGSQQPCFVNIYFNDGHGSFNENPIVAVNENHLPNPSSKYNLVCSPNPVRNQAVFSFKLPQPSPAKLCVYNMQGELLTSLIADHSQDVEWNVNNNEKPTPGVYIAKLLINENPVESIRIIVL